MVALPANGFLQLPVAPTARYITFLLLILATDTLKPEAAAINDSPAENWRAAAAMPSRTSRAIAMARGDDGNLWQCPCGLVYRVKEGETLQAVSAKCHAPLLLVDNPHVEDADDVSPGVPLKITCIPTS
ncbi:hypothetical protein KP509_19G057600 [Ceratopteris richardii]|uniref:LysM domain-containing protein n=1 Tax=Ceratopteris richardii TaxID=49495 RepID=A0A8T2SMM4_CERRI|nr:hypothetical protein KP509_19G057600 [Ceratopteris richardii]